MLAKTIGAKAIGIIEVFTKKYLLGKTKFHQEMLDPFIRRKNYLLKKTESYFLRVELE